MDEQEQAQQSLVEMFRRDQARAEASRAGKPRRRLDPRARAWLLAVAVVVFALAPVIFIVAYPRFGPVDTMTSFCRAEGEGEYAAAYALLSKQARQRTSLDAFTQASRAANLMTCFANHGIPLIFGGTRASLDTTYQIANNPNGGLDGSMTFVRESGGWRVDSMSPDLFHFSS